MNDRELLEAAAKAEGHGVEFCEKSGLTFYDSRFTGLLWNPLHNDGDALRLAVKLRLSIDHNHPADNEEWVMAAGVAAMGIGPTEEVDGEISRSAATRRAIVRAAAEIGGKP